MKAMSLFSNCGAGDVGYKKAGFEFKVMAELNPNRLSVALANHPTAVGVPRRPAENLDDRDRQVESF